MFAPNHPRAKSPSAKRDVKQDSEKLYRAAIIESDRSKLLQRVKDADAAIQSEREAYKGAALELLDLVYLVIEGPDPRSKYAEGKGLWIDGGEVKRDSAPAAPVPIEQLDAFAYWFFVRDWNSFIHVAARDARLQWYSKGDQNLHEQRVHAGSS
jgi:hypothetical protein